MSRTYVIIVNWNGWADTLECLESLLLSTDCIVHPVVCDNGSSDDSVARIIEWAGWKHLSLRMVSDAIQEEQGDASLSIVTLKENLGFAAGSNAGIRLALQDSDCSYVWLLNNDTIVTPGAHGALVKYVGSAPSVGMCGSTLLYADFPDRVQAQGGAYYCKWLGLAWPIGWWRRSDALLSHKNASRFLSYINGASLFVTRRFVEKIGLLSEDYFLYFEELDWSIRAAGEFRLGYASDSVVFHKVGRSIGTSSNPASMSYTSDYFNIRNRLLFTRRFYPAALPTVWLVIVGSLIVRLCLGKWDRAVMIIRLLCGCNDLKFTKLPECRVKQ